MRPTLLIAAAALVLAAAPAALAQNARVLGPRTDASSNFPAADELPPPPSPEDELHAKAMADQLAALDARMETDEITMTGLRNGELAAENARIRKIKPALPFHGPTFLPPLFW